MSPGSVISSAIRGSNSGHVAAEVAADVDAHAAADGRDAVGHVARHLPDAGAERFGQDDAVAVAGGCRSSDDERVQAELSPLLVDAARHCRGLRCRSVTARASAAGACRGTARSIVRSGSFGLISTASASRRLQPNRLAGRQVELELGDLETGVAPERRRLLRDDRRFRCRSPATRRLVLERELRVGDVGSRLPQRHRRRQAAPTESHTATRSMRIRPAASCGTRRRPVDRPAPACRPASSPAARASPCGRPCTRPSRTKLPSWTCFAEVAAVADLCLAVGPVGDQAVVDPFPDARAAEPRMGCR